MKIPSKLILNKADTENTGKYSVYQLVLNVSNINPRNKLTCVFKKNITEIAKKVSFFTDGGIDCFFIVNFDQIVNNPSLLVFGV